MRGEAVAIRLESLALTRERAVDALRGEEDATRETETLAQSELRRTLSGEQRGGDGRVAVEQNCVLLLTIVELLAQ